MWPVVWHVRGASKGSTGSGLASVHAGDVCVVVCDEPHEESSVYAACERLPLPPAGMREQP